MTQTARRREIPKAYDPGSVEQGIYDYWMREGYFTPEIDHSAKPFVMIMPPPNVTGELHMGHALTIAIEDMVVRWHRMRGEPTLFLPGTDHAGIATQVVVEKMLAGDGITRHDVGRDRFVEHVWAWVDQYGDRIQNQVKRLGASCDWTRSRFTLDDGPSSAVRTTFVNLYKKGLIYRGERMTNWCPRCRTALSDLEVKHQEEDSSLYYIRYAREDGDGSITVATTRPETLLGDTGVAVNPDDGRYADLIGKNVVLPVLKRAIPVVGDDSVDSEFGTGALKVTPGHDQVDFEIGQRHGLPVVNVISPDGSMNDNAGPYEGQERSECRANIVEQLENEGLLERVEPHTLSIGHCERCDDVVEPTVSLQWWMRMESLAKPARDAVVNGTIEIVPERFTKVYFNWMDNIRDWCLSRQLWWGHRIPVWYCDDCDEVNVEMERPRSCTRCSSTRLTRDPDVLDTWFSSALWTHSTLGWPQQSEDLDYFYPTSVMETGYDILFFWVAKMIMMGIENTGEAPFHTVYLHGLVLDPEGVKMSKSKGNVTDPLGLIDLYGSDALRFALTTGNSPGNNMRLNESKLEASRNFANKLWNASRFVMSNLEDAAGIDRWYQPEKPAHRHDRWILSRFNTVAAQVHRFMEEYQFGEAQRVIHDFLWSEYCDWYIEMAKIRLRDPDAEGPSPLPVLAYVLERVLRLLHPFMPFVTEELWQILKEYLPEEPQRPEALIIAPYPEADESMIDRDAETEIAAVIELTRAARNVRAEFRVSPSQPIPVRVYAAPELTRVYDQEAAVIQSNAGVQVLSTGPTGDVESSVDEVVQVLAQGTLVLSLSGLVDLREEAERLGGELADLDAYRAKLSTRLQDESFLSRAPEEVVDKERQRLEATEERRTRVEEILSRLAG
jgi:valyl-tRNA synthetase